jgi:hypothetical protein
MKNTLFLAILLLVFKPIYAQTWWNQYCSGEKGALTNNTDVIKKIMTSSSDLTERCEAHLVSAWGKYYQKSSPEEIINSLNFLIDSMIIKNQRSEPIQNVTNDECFVLGFRALLDSLRQMDMMSANGYSSQKVQELNSILAYLERLLPDHLKTCVDVSFNVLDEGSSVEFIIRVKDCKAEVDNKGIPRGRVGYPDIYKALADWYENTVLKGLGKTLSSEKRNTTIEIKGLADGYLVLGDIQLGRNIGIPLGLEYYYMGVNFVSTKVATDTKIESSINLSSRSNEYLALARAYLAHKELNKIASRSLIVAQEFAEKGDNYRGVEIKITAKGILDDLTNKQLKYTKEMRQQNNTKIDNIEAKVKKLK